MTPSTEKYNCDSCDFGTNGAVCALHGVEVERRVNNQKLLDALSQNVDVLSKWRYLAIGVSLLATLFICGAYYFTADTKYDVNLNAARLETKVETLTIQVSTLATAIAVTEARHNELLRQLESLTRTIGNRNSGQLEMHDPRG